MLGSYPKLKEVVRCLETWIAKAYPDFFGEAPTHPCHKLKPKKVIHDNLWGTRPFSWRELAIIDCPFFQRLRGIHQTGLAFHVYPSAHHTRFEHSLGVCTLASNTFDAFRTNNDGELVDIAKALEPNTEAAETIRRWREELRLAALLHDTGHSLFSHTSEQVYSQIDLLQEAATELSKFVGRKKGEGEVLSFCFSRTEGFAKLLQRSQNNVVKQGERPCAIDLDNVSLLIVGRSKHPFLQFMGDIISSDLDADKLDYLLRDASFAGLPLRYDLDRYLYTVRIAKDKLLDGEGYLQGLYASLGVNVERKSATSSIPAPYYEAYRLRLPRQAMSTVEQIVICKFMLFSYIYHHKKVRASEGLLALLLNQALDDWRAAGENDEILLEHFLGITDSALDGPVFLEHRNSSVVAYCNRIRYRLIPREVCSFVAKGSSHAEGALVANFISQLMDQDRRAEVIQKFEQAMGAELLKLEPTLGKSPREILLTAGVWLDVPKPPKFENIHLLIGDPDDAVSLAEVFPIEYWIQAYEAHRYRIRVFAFSEYFPQAKVAVRTAVEAVVGIHSKTYLDALLAED